jgi:hypothetical protein
MTALIVNSELETEICCLLRLCVQLEIQLKETRRELTGQRHGLIDGIPDAQQLKLCRAMRKLASGMIGTLGMLTPKS